MKPDSESPPVNRKRRLLLGWGGAGLLATLASLFGWRSARHKDLGSASSSRSSSSPAAPASTGDSATQAPAAAVPGPMSREAFLPQLNTDFHFEVDGLSRDCKLIEVSDARTLHAPKNVNYTAFTLLFQSHAAYKFEGGTYRVSHPQMGTMDLFLSPVGNSKKHSHLEAVFSQRV